MKELKSRQTLTANPRGQISPRSRAIIAKLKPGVTFWRSEINKQLRIGTRFLNFALTDWVNELEVEPALVALQAGAAKPNPDLLILISILRQLQLIDTEYTEIDYHYQNEHSSDIASLRARSVAQESFLERLRIEADSISRLPEIYDGGTRKILERREFKIEIHGTGRIATTLFGILIATGFDSCSLVANQSQAATISATQLIGGAIKRHDIGGSLEQILGNLRADASLYPESRDSVAATDLVISIGSPPPESLQRWLKSRVRQLFMDSAGAGEIRIGPYVTPGDGACYNCINIAESEAGLPITHSLQNDSVKSDSVKSDSVPSSKSSTEIAAALAVHSASVIALEVAGIADTGRSNLHQRTISIAARQYLEPQVTSWEQSPRCGCNWV